MNITHNDATFTANVANQLMTQKLKTERIPQRVLDELLLNVSLLGLIRESTHVKSIGDEHKAQCPFHVRGDTGNSLLIDTQEQRFQCSECEFHGSAIGWLMFHDGLSFQDSVFELSARSSVDVSQWITNESLDSARLSKMELLREVEEFYSSQISHSDTALSYIQSRGLTDSTLERYGVGYSPDGDEAFNEQFSAKTRTLWNQGLLVRLADGQYRRRFKNRLMFPIRNIEGNTVGFGGRSLGDGLPKYLNSPSSPTFNKSTLLYGLHESLRDSPDNKRLILVEGYIDVLSLSQNGYTGAVATLGTAPSEHHIKTIFKHSDKLIACFDGDSAGLKAAERLLFAALPHLSNGSQLEFALLPPGQDPDSLIRDEGKNSFNDYLESTVSTEHFFHDTLSRSIDLSGIGGKAKLASVARPAIELIKSEELRQSVIDIIEESIGIPWFDIPDA